MSLFDFLKDAGEKLFRHRPPHAPQQSQDAGRVGQQGAGPGQQKPWNPQQVQEANQDSAAAIQKYLQQQKLDAAGVKVQFDALKGVVTLEGTVPDQATREKIVLAAGNVNGVSQVDDRMTTSQPGTQSKFYTVKPGDTLSAISKQFYGDANQYNRIFEANQPMLKDPDKIYPGQNLRIPMG